MTLDFQTASSEELTGIDPSLLAEQQLLEYTERLLTLGMVPNDDEDGGDEAAEVPAGKEVRDEENDKNRRVDDRHMQGSIFFSSLHSM